jgi:hypothetical protein
LTVIRLGGSERPIAAMALRTHFVTVVEKFLTQP